MSDVKNVWVKREMGEGEVKRGFKVKGDKKGRSWWKVKRGDEKWIMRKVDEFLDEGEAEEEF